MIKIIYVIFGICVTRIFSILNRYRNNVFPRPAGLVQAPWLTMEDGQHLYPWLGRLIPYHRVDRPTICTVACVSPKIFVTSARCIIGLTVEMATVSYDQMYLKTKAFVVADEDKHSEQYFDDIGIVVVSDAFTLKWHTVPIMTGISRTNSGFQWLEDMHLEEGPQTHQILAFHEEMDGTFLHHLNVTVTVSICDQIFNLNAETQNYFVPCALPCTVLQHLANSPTCQQYVKIEGAIVYDFLRQELFGVVTWGLPSEDVNLPVGLAVANSDSFLENLKCAKLIASDATRNPKVGYFQRLCDKTRRQYDFLENLQG